MLVQGGLDERSGNAHDGGTADAEDVEKPRVRQCGAFSRSQILLKTVLSGHPSPKDGARHADDRPGENHHVCAGVWEQ
jgi:hypothetical protein